MRKVGTQGPKAPKSGTPNPNPIRGSDKNKKGAASKAGGYKVSAREESVLQEKSDKFNEEFKSKLGYGSTLGQLKSVFARGMGAFQVSHSPKVSSATQWAYARVNAFLYLMKNGRPKNPGYIQDNDLLPSGHKAKSKLTKNHNRPGDHPQKNGMPVAGKKKLAKIRGKNSKAAKSLRKEKQGPEKSLSLSKLAEVEGFTVGEFDQVYVRSSTKLFHKNDEAKGKALSVIGKKTKKVKGQSVLIVEDDDGNVYNIKVSKLKLFSKKKAEAKIKKEEELEAKKLGKKKLTKVQKKKLLKEKIKKEGVELTDTEKKNYKEKVRKSDSTEKTRLDVDKAVVDTNLMLDTTSGISYGLRPQMEQYREKIKNSTYEEGIESWSSVSYTEFRQMDRKTFKNWDLTEQEEEDLEKEYESFKSAVKMAPKFRSSDGNNYVYRGGTLGSRDEKLDKILKAGVGGVVSEGAHHSMSRSFEVASSFASKSTGVMMRIKSKTGRMIENVSMHEDEMEIVGLPETKYRIKSIKENVFPTRVNYLGKASAGPNGYRLFIDLEEI